MNDNRYFNRSELIGILMLRPQGLFALKVRK